MEETIVKTAREMLMHTVSLVGGDRAQTHGDKVDNHLKIANLWSMYLHNMGERAKYGFNAEDVANMMELLKIARRQSGAHNPDDYADGAGYASVAFECAEAAQVEQTETATKRIGSEVKKALTNDA